MRKNFFSYSQCSVSLNYVWCFWADEQFNGGDKIAVSSAFCWLEEKRFMKIMNKNGPKTEPCVKLRRWIWDHPIPKSSIFLKVVYDQPCRKPFFRSRTVHCVGSIWLYLSRWIVSIRDIAASIELRSSLKSNCVTSRTFWTCSLFFKLVLAFFQSSAQLLLV